MRLISVCLLACGLVCAQTPRIAVIDFYGLGKTPESALRMALGVKEGDPLPPSKADVEERLQQVGGVTLARLQAVCCEAGGAILFVGIEEKGAPHFNLRPSPQSAVELPQEVLDAYRAFLDARDAAARSGESGEDLTRGYALSADPAVRASQERFTGLASSSFGALRDVLRNSGVAEQRTMAAYVIGYAAGKKAAVDELLNALQDPDDGVRNNAIRALTALAVYAAKNPEAALRIPPTWVVEMLHSIFWDDRTRAVNLLLTLTESRDQGALDLIRDRGSAQLIEIARWKSLAYALPALILLGRTAGLTDEQIQDFWSRGEREAVIAKAAGPAAKPAR
jgi:hypothetical protein